jgi:hypothetical protein
LKIEYQPFSDLKLSVTNWIGPGFNPFDGRHLQSPYSADSYDGVGGLIDNWQGPNLDAGGAGTVYFLDANAKWQIRPDLSVALEYMLAKTPTSTGHWGWYGAMVLVNYDVTDRLHLFGRWSYLDDSNWIITGDFQNVREFSGGVGYNLFQGMEARFELRNDDSNATGSVNSASIHFTFTF